MRTMMVMMMLAAPALASAETVEEYCMVLASKNLAGKITLSVDYGEQGGFMKSSSTRVRTDDGKVAKFKSVIDALNYMAQDGWKFTDAYPLGAGGNYVLHYVMRREVAK